MNQQDQNWMVKPKPPIQGCAAYLEQKARLDAYLATYDADASNKRRLEISADRNNQRNTSCSSEFNEANGESI